MSASGVMKGPFLTVDARIGPLIMGLGARAGSRNVGPADQTEMRSLPY